MTLLTLIHDLATEHTIADYDGIPPRLTDLLDAHAIADHSQVLGRLRILKSTPDGTWELDTRGRQLRDASAPGDLPHVTPDTPVATVVIYELLRDGKAHLVHGILTAHYLPPHPDNDADRAWVLLAGERAPGLFPYADLIAAA